MRKFCKLRCLMSPALPTELLWHIKLVGFLGTLGVEPRSQFISRNCRVKLLCVLPTPCTYLLPPDVPIFKTPCLTFTNPICMFNKIAVGVFLSRRMKFLKDLNLLIFKTNIKILTKFKIAVCAFINFVLFP